MLSLLNLSNFQKISIQNLIKKWQETVDLFDIELIIAGELKKNQAFIISHSEFKLNFWQRLKIEKNLKKRAKNVPLAYLTGKKEFYGRDFFVNKNTLIPRPETELIIENFLEKVENKVKNKYLILDIGTGSGNIILTLAKELEKEKNNFEFLASDISKKALKIAKKNAKFHDIENLIGFFHSNLLKNEILKEKIKVNQKEIIIIANLPYVNLNFKNTLLQKKESKSLKFEPHSALWSKDEGLKHYTDLTKELQEIFEEKIKFTTYFEISFEQKKYLTKKIENYFPKAKIEFKKDLANFDRLCIWKNF